MATARGFSSRVGEQHRAGQLRTMPLLPYFAMTRLARTRASSSFLLKGLLMKSVAPPRCPVCVPRLMTARLP